MQKVLLKNDNLKEGCQKALKKLTLFFLLNVALLNGQDYEKRGLELVTSSSSVTKQVQKNSFISDVLPDQV